MSNNFNDFLKNLDPKTLSDGIKKAQEFAKTPEGKKTLENLKNGNKVNGTDKNEILNLLRDNPELVKKLNELM